LIPAVQVFWRVCELLIRQITVAVADLPAYAVTSPHDQAISTRRANDPRQHARQRRAVARLSADPWPDHVPVPSFRPRHRDRRSAPCGGRSGHQQKPKGRPAAFWLLMDRPRRGNCGGLITRCRRDCISQPRTKDLGTHPPRSPRYVSRASGWRKRPAAVARACH
jgi:hypothetical protein